MPPYIVLTNTQLARVASGRPQSLADLKKIPGLGQSRLERFGKDLLEMVANSVASREDGSKGDVSGDDSINAAPSRRGDEAEP